ncbi:outer membrane beta-barrel protein [Litoribacter alkaliphilus]|uniref:Outer membrane beta-barrel protein n=1 Tax=Litoribacter ruber TaxID=702568 RepID=A0AAP2G6N2_9BACT|nr:DUF6089 family protein [Litoribacter alkaliphilus]MBS9525878.1 outer membrane beta-barrel protein [Litoribacter alkaliphilus]
MFKKLLLSICLVVLLATSGKAQFNRDHFFISAGPSMIYGDNAGIYSDFRFRILPAIGIGYNYELSRHWDLRASIGNQWISSGNYYSAESRRARLWSETDEAIRFNGTAIYADIMPTFQLNPNIRGRVGNVVNYYMGAGIGLMHSSRQDKLLIENPFTETTGLAEQSGSTTSLYVPLRFGVSTNLEQEWDIAFEGSSFIAFSSDIDGNTSQWKQVKPDVLLQFQIIVKRYIGRY